MSNITIKKEAWEFLLFSYFGSIEPKIEDCINRAYRDLCRTLGGIALEEIKIKDCTNENKERCKEKFKNNEVKRNWKKEITDIIENAIGELKSKNTLNQEKFNCWHNKTCNEIEKKSINVLKNLGITFNYGHAQKWLNMTLKYQMILDVEFGSKIRAFMHVPVDSFIMEAASNCKIEVDFIKQKKNGEYSDTNSTAWSKWEENDYITFQNKLREVLGVQFPIDWEAMEWIAIAKKRTEDEIKRESDREGNIRNALYGSTNEPNNN